MTPKEKAIELYEKFIFPCWECDEFDRAKQCALIAVDEMTSQMLSLMKVFNEDRSEFEAIELDYLTRVKQEIEKL
jgi:hypothetical protein